MGTYTAVPLTKASVGLDQVDNTSDAAKNSASASLTNKTIDGDLNTLSDIAQSSVTGLATDLAAKEPTITAGTTSQYWRGDKSFQTLDKSAVGLGSVDNTADADKPISTATQTALNAKQSTSEKGAANGYASLDTNGKVPGSQLPNSIMTYEGLHDASANTPTLSDATGDAGQVYRVTTGGSRDYGSGTLSLVAGDYLIHNGSVWEKADTTDAISSINGYTGSVTLTKSDVGLGNVDNTSDADKNSATATLTNKTLASPAITGTASVAQTGALSVFNTADQTTNTESLRAQYVSNVAEVGAFRSGTGTARVMRIGTNFGTESSLSSTTSVRLELNPTSSPLMGLRVGQRTTGTLVGIGQGDQAMASSATQNLVSIVTAINQSGTAGYTGLLINPTENTTGSGTKRLISAQTGGTDRFTVDNVGNVGAAGTISQAGVPVVTTTGAQSLENKTLVSPTLTTPVLGTPSSGTLTNCTGLPVAGISATGTRDSTTYLRGDGSWAQVSGETFSPFLLMGA